MTLNRSDLPDGGDQELAADILRAFVKICKNENTSYDHFKGAFYLDTEYRPEPHH